MSKVIRCKKGRFRYKNVFVGSSTLKCVSNRTKELSENVIFQSHSR